MASEQTRRLTRTSAAFVVTFRRYFLVSLSSLFDYKILEFLETYRMKDGFDEFFFEGLPMPCVEISTFVDVFDELYDTC
jgi:hypothetical protein